MRNRASFPQSTGEAAYKKKSKKVWKLHKSKFFSLHWMDMLYSHSFTKEVKSFFVSSLLSFSQQNTNERAMWIINR